MAYEGLAAALSHDAVAGIRNGADVLLKSLFIMLGGRRGLVAFDLLLAGTGAWLVWRDLRRGGGLRAGVFAVMLLESVAYAAAFGAVTGWITSAILSHTPRLAVAASAGVGALDLRTQLVVSLGAGIYEELLFRVLLVSGMVWVGRRVLGLGPLAAGVAATLAAALVFSAFHYVGPYADRFAVASFTFRFVAGVLLSALYLLRGFGITAWTHALYDVMLTLTGV